ncbi:phospholipase [Granulicella sp. dw_53]|uniref:alpha/beta hydrolase n=1 Tax=Granulicella sp. dw_53 TaxID=2719792 RepID=UPI001BD3AE64|nr:phospholipase [Granulicella sp. dw_53]
MSSDPHRDGPVRHWGRSLEGAAGAVVLLHGRGASAEDILSLAEAMGLPQFAYLAPQAAGNAWYPYSFLAPLEQNEPWLSSALQKVKTTVQMAQDAGIPSERIVVGGFSQGACLATEFVASYPLRYGGLIALTGGLIGPPGSDLKHSGDLAGMPAFLGSGDPDPHVPWQRVEESARILGEMRASVTTRRYEGRGHTVSHEELVMAKNLIEGALLGSVK